MVKARARIHEEQRVARATFTSSRSRYHSLLLSPCLDARWQIRYIAAASNPLVVVDVRTEPSVSFGTPMELPLSLPRPSLLSGDVRGYDVLPDGRIISMSPATDPDSTGREPKLPNDTQRHQPDVH